MMEDDREYSFLGRGWAFPPEFHGGTSPTSMVSEEEDIEQSLCILFSTRVGERLMRPDYGVNLHRLVFHQMDLTARTQLKDAIEQAVLYYEPRITLNDVVFDMSEERNGVLRVCLEYTIRLTNTRGNLVYPYYYEEHF